MKEIGRYFVQSDASAGDPNRSGHGLRASSGSDIRNAEASFLQAVLGCHMGQEPNVTACPCERKLIMSGSSWGLRLEQEYSH